MSLVGVVDNFGFAFSIAHFRAFFKGNKGFFVGGVKKTNFLWGPLNILREASGEKIFCQSKQKTARRVHPLRRIFVMNDGKDSADSSCEEFLEVPLY